MAAGFPYQVGEQGPEIFVPSVPGTILNGAQTERVMSGGGGSGGGQGAAGPQVIHLTGDQTVSVTLPDGRELFRAIQPYASQWIVRNRGANDGTWVPK